MSPAMSSRSHETGDPAGERAIVVRSLDSLSDFQRAEQVQRDAWGYSDTDIVPASIFSVARNFGGQAFGAFYRSAEVERMVGFGLSFGAVDDGHAHFHSHMVGIVPEFQNRGLGRRIKLEQREDALRRGIDQIVWTFDPLQRRNAFFNIARLGGIGVRYLPNVYGTTSSPLHGGMPTDRLVIEWNLNSPQVALALRGEQPVRMGSAIAVELPAASGDVPIEVRLAGQARLRRELTELLDAGYAITGFEGRGPAAHYILEPYERGGWEKR